ncbi:hypothetical protein ACFL2Z_05360 [Candidatus Eisenbacteria bacterium]|uniref:Outer membrane protein beta-barrel domain-containing protein n=1 Tax=Eiseniibacteriota bacterium TaxID=2212470 RepID=A0ABV6YQH6_UNCEI
MSRIARVCIISSALVLLASAAGSAPLIRLGASFDLGYPQDEFRDNVDNTGIGGGLFVLVGSSGFPAAIGASVDFMQYGSEEREAPWSATIPDVFVDVSTTNDLVAGHLFVRLQPSTGFFQPYLEGLLGFEYLWTSTSVSDQGVGGEEIASTKHISDLAFSYGGGAGLLFRVWKPSEEMVSDAAVQDEDDVEMKSVGVFLDARFMRGSEADYLKEGSITVENGKVEYDVRRSRTDLLVFRLGVSFSLL